MWFAMVDASFLRGYGHTKIDQTILAYYRYERIIEDIAIYAQELLETHNGLDRLFVFRPFMSQFEPNGLGDIAKKTYKACHDK